MEELGPRNDTIVGRAVTGRRLLRAAFAFGLVAMALTLRSPAAGAATCGPHGSSERVRVTMCVTRLDSKHCRLVFKLRYQKLGITDTFGGKVPCTHQPQRSLQTGHEQFANALAIAVQAAWNDIGRSYGMHFSNFACSHAGRRDHRTIFSCTANVRTRSGRHLHYRGVFFPDGTPDEGRVR